MKDTDTFSGVNRYLAQSIDRIMLGDVESLPTSEKVYLAVWIIYILSKLLFTRMVHNRNTPPFGYPLAGLKVCIDEINA